MKKYLLVVLCITPLYALAQSASVNQAASSPAGTMRNGIGLVPSGAQCINGFALTLSMSDQHKQPVQVRGFNLDANPVGIFLGAFSAMYTPFGVVNPAFFVAKGDTLTKKQLYKIDTFHAEHSWVNKNVAGFNLQFFGDFESNLKGVGISGIMGDYEKQQGIAISGIINIANDFKGAQVSLWANTSITGSGVQIALFNECADCKGIQIGLLNRNGRSLQPIVNWRRKHQVEYYVPGTNTKQR